MFKSIIEEITSRPISVDFAENIANQLLSGQFTDIETAAILTAIKVKGHSFEVIYGFTKAMKSKCMQFDKNYTAIDVCGTGGDGLNTFNISSTVALLISKKIKVIKHGNGSITSRSGSADLYQSLNLPIYSSKEKLLATMEEEEFTFLFAPYVHPKMGAIMPARRAISTPTIFNVIGPLCNPTSLEYQVIGVYDEALMLPVAQTLKSLGIKRGAVVHGHNGMDELSTTGINKVLYILDGKIIKGSIDPIEYGFDRQELEDLKGGSPSQNAALTLDILQGNDVKQKHIVALNAGLALYISSVAASIKDGIQMAYGLMNQSTLELNQEVVS